MKINLLKLVAGLAASVLFWQCGTAPSSPPPSAPVAAKPKAVAAVDAGIPAALSEALLSYSYNPIGKRDPFRGLVALSANLTALGDGGVSDPTICTEALCRFDLEELTLVAVVSGDANPLAMVEDPSRTGYLVRRNTKIGKNGGKVTAIQRNCLQVTTYVTSAEGKSLPNRVDLCVKVDEKMRDPLDLLKNKVD